MTLSQYPQLKQQIVISVSNTNKHNNILIDLKEHYKDKIKSPRRNEQIQTIGQLLLVLEIRDLLSENDVTPLRDIAQRVDNCGDLLNKIEHFERTHVPTEKHDYYAPDDTQERIFYDKHKKFNDLTNKNSYTNVSQTKKERISGIVVQHLGISWRDLARNLKVSECMIDVIDKECVTLYSKTVRLLEIYEEKADPEKWAFVLCESLERARRKDLAKAIQDVLVMNL